MDNTGLEIAVVGMAGRFPGADNLDEFWRRLHGGEESVTRFSEEELRAEGIHEEQLRHPNYIRAKPYITSIHDFDAELFGYTAWEVEHMDPQIKLFHECVYHALEDAGYCSDLYAGRIGLYAGASVDINWMRSVLLSQEVANVEILETGLVSYKDFMSQLISYKLNLTGPSISLYTACSTSLAAVHLAAQGLLLGDCNVAVAGAVTIIQPNKCGYMYNEGGIHSPTGQCRVFDAEANGTIFGDGGGAIVMRRLSDAVRDRDHIYAVIQSTACNNDGRRKVGFVAPSADGQTEVIRTAFEMGEVDPESVSLLEAHGTGTRVGDPIELKALKNAFHTEKNSFCAIGSVKANVGHLHAGAGMAGLVKVVLAMNHEVIPPVINFVAPNPELGIEQSPFYINKQALPWEAGEKPRRAGISSFGVGGTNVHVILRDYPRQTAPDVNGKTILYLSAKNENALQEAKDNMIAFLRSSRENIHDIAYTLIMGRKHYACKAICIVEDAWDAAEALYDRKRLFCCGQMKKTRPVAFVFPGLGCQYYGMGGAIYRNEPEFRALVDRISARMKLVLGFDLSQIIAEKNDNLAQRIDETLVAWSVLLTVSYALARTLMHYGVQPALMIDRCAGELTVAVLEDSMDALCELMTGASEQEDLKLFEEQRARAMRDDYLFLELGPTAPSQSEMAERVISVVPREKENAAEAWLACLACLEAERIPINWNNFYRHRARRRIPLPLYPFQRQRYQNSRIIENLGVHAKAGERAEPPRDESKGAIFTRSGFDASYTPPETDVQRIICETAAEVLSIDSVGIHDDFYSLGGHSLLFTRIISQLKQIFQTEIPLDEVFDQPTVASIERIIRRQWNDSQILDEIAAAYREYQENDRGVV